MKKILVVDDQVSMVKQLELIFKMKKYEVVAAGDGAGGITAYAQTNPDVVFLDLGLPDMDGADVLAQILAKNPDAKVAVISGHSDRKEELLAKGAKNFFSKPFMIPDLLKWIEEMTKG